MSRRSGTYIWVVGPDGCGKSTISSKLAHETGALQRYWRPGILPMAGQLVGRAADDDVNTEPHSVTRNGHARQLARLIYYFADYLLGYWLVFRPALRRGQHVIVDRGWHDMAVDWRRYQLRGPDGARRLGRLVREPDLLIVVTVPPEVAVKRKRELPVAEVARQYDEWSRLRLRHGRLVELDNSGPIRDTLATAAKLVHGGA